MTQASRITEEDDEDEENADEKSQEEVYSENDLELVPRQFGPMIKVKMFLREIQGKSRNKKKKIMTDPDCENIRNDMFEVVTNMHDALNHIKRCEAVVFPNLKLKSQYL